MLQFCAVDVLRVAGAVVVSHYRSCVVVLPSCCAQSLIPIDRRKAAKVSVKF